MLVASVYTPSGHVQAQGEALVLFAKALGMLRNGKVVNMGAATFNGVDDLFFPPSSYTSFLLFFFLPLPCSLLYYTFNRIL